jgi:hypothetical protein
MKADYSDLKPGDEGFWPLVGGRPDDLRDGDRLVEDGEVVGTVSDVRIAGPVVCFKIGEASFRIGRLHGIHIDRWGTHAQLGRYI